MILLIRLSTITLAANALVENGAAEVYACCTHPVLSGPAVERINNSKIKELVVTNSIKLPDEKKSTALSSFLSDRFWLKRLSAFTRNNLSAIYSAKPKV